MLGHYFATALTDPPTLRDLMGRIYPTLKAVEMKAEGLGTLTEAAREHVRSVLQARLVPLPTRPTLPEAQEGEAPPAGPDLGGPPDLVEPQAQALASDDEVGPGD